MASVYIMRNFLNKSLPAPSSQLPALPVVLYRLWTCYCTFPSVSVSFSTDLFLDVIYMHPFHLL